MSNGVPDFSPSQILSFSFVSVSSTGVPSSHIRTRLPFTISAPLASALRYSNSRKSSLTKSSASTKERYLPLAASIPRFLEGPEPMFSGFFKMQIRGSPYAASRITSMELSVPQSSTKMISISCRVCLLRL